MTHQPTFLATSLKMYFDHDETVSWAREVRAVARRSRLVQSGAVELVVFPSFPSVAEVVGIFADTSIAVGAQNVATTGRGPFTGEVSARSLKQVGCQYVEIGHSERRRLFCESIADIQQKVLTSVENGLRPLLCVGEESRGSDSDAAAQCIRFLEDSLGHLPSTVKSPIVLAYEPVWAIGADNSASVEYIQGVTGKLQAWLNERPPFAGSTVIYGGSAGPGLLSELNGSVSGLFLGRFAHDPGALERILSEIADLG